MYRIIPLLLLALVGCRRTSPPAIPPTAGDFVNINEDVGTAKIFGIEFSAPVNAGGASTDESINANFVEPEKSSARKRFTLGDDITIQLDSLDESEVQFLFNDQDFGVLHVGDKVVIDDERNVEINGTPRSPKAVE